MTDMQTGLIWGAIYGAVITLIVIPFVQYLCFAIGQFIYRRKHAKKQMR